MVKVPLLLQLPAMAIVPEFMVIAPAPVRLPVSVTEVVLVLNVAVPPAVLQLPPIVSVPEAVVLAPAPEKVRF